MRVLAIDVCVCAPYSYLIEFFVKFRSINSFQWASFQLGHFRNEEFTFDLFKFLYQINPTILQAIHFHKLSSQFQQDRRKLVGLI